MAKLSVLASLAISLTTVAGQTFQRLGTCPSLGCILPPDQQDFLPGQQFDIRFEVHAPVNGSEAFNNGVPDEKFTVTIQKDGGYANDIASFFHLQEEPELEKWTFSWYEDLFAKEAGNKSVVNVASKIYRRVALYEPGKYTVTLNFYDEKTTAHWLVQPLAKEKKAKNVIFFIGVYSRCPNKGMLPIICVSNTRDVSLGDGMTSNMITAARLLAHKSINGRYQKLLSLDKFPVLGHQMVRPP